MSTKVYYNAAENYMEKIIIYYHPAVLNCFFENGLNSYGVRNFVLCEVMSDRCGFDVDRTGDCQAKHEELLMLGDGSYFDGDTTGCQNSSQCACSD